jgi:hypothetical protein
MLSTMDPRLRRALAAAAEQHGAVGRAQLLRLGVGESLRRSWERRGLLRRRGPGSFVVGGSPPTWRRELWCAQLDLAGRGYIAGRSGARLHRLDGFAGGEVELITTRGHRRMSLPWTLHSTAAPLGRGDTVLIEGLRCLTVSRLILEAPLFGFSATEMEDAIDSAIRLRKVSEQRLRTAVVAAHRSGVNGSRALLDALVDTGGESRLERRFLAIVRRAGLPRPELRHVVRDGSRIIARLDAMFPGGLVVEIEGHATHSSRRQRTTDETRRNALVGCGAALRVFTYTHVTLRPDYVEAELREALGLRAA